MIYFFPGIRRVMSCIFRQLLVLQNVVNIMNTMDITPQDLPVPVFTQMDHHSGIDPYHISCGIRDAGDVDHPQRIGEINWLENAPIHLAAVLPLVVLS